MYLYYYKSSITFFEFQEYCSYQSSTCSSSSRVQYNAYSDMTCFQTGWGSSIKFMYPNRLLYSDSRCRTNPTSARPLEVDTCFNWVEENGYSDYNGLPVTLYAPFMVISSSGSRKSLRASLTRSLLFLIIHVRCSNYISFDSSFSVHHQFIDTNPNPHE